MNQMLRTLSCAVLALAGTQIQAEDFRPLMDVVHATWADKTHIGVICDYSRSRSEIDDLAVAAGAGSRITVLDTRSRANLGRAVTAAVLNKPDYLVLLNHDSLAPCGSVAATALVHDISRHGIPSVATRAVGIRQGVAFAIGDDTGDDVLVNDRLVGTVQVILPQRGSYVKTALWPALTGKAEVQVGDLYIHSAKESR